MDTAAPSTISDQTILTGETSGTVTVLDGGTLVIDGSHDGTVVLEGGGALFVRGVLNGALEVGSLSTATISGDVSGKIDIRIAGTIVVEGEGRVAGPVANYGSFTNRGLRSGPVVGREPDDQDGAVNAEPVHPGIYNYTLPPRG
ncbi:MAG: hypothetical protein BGO97_07385 [Micrococcales bacterium 70-64]|nr:hypothetical protein [Leifsonia sp.]ODU63874.1 MAG: hypothetical protein ABT06_07390 [Leifsonia sp. SCN 70-46]OJX85565.1 MAG: hypothetical protein BGO97_07385 [Micrococcales bacterium 70-64]